MYLDKNGRKVYTNYEIDHGIVVSDQIVETIKKDKKLPVFFNAVHFIQKCYNSYGNDEITNMHIHNVYHIASHQNEYYRNVEIPKRNGQKRTLTIPNEKLKKIQQYILKNIFTWYNPTIAAMAYISKRGIKQNALTHISSNYILKLDIHDFFGSIHFGKVVNNILPPKIYSLELRTLLANLCMCDNKLPQGAPTSPLLSNIVMNKFDEIMLEYVKDKNIKYTRYADDMIFSSTDYFNYGRIIVKVKYLLNKYYDMQLNDEKTKFLHKGLRQEICGVMVNEIVQVPKKYRDSIRQEMYYLDKYGIEKHIYAMYYDQKIERVLEKEEYYQRLLGKINYVLTINDKDKEFISYKKQIKQYLGKEKEEGIKDEIRYYYLHREGLIIDVEQLSARDYLLYCFQNDVVINMELVDIDYYKYDYYEMVYCEHNKENCYEKYFKPEISKMVNTPFLSFYLKNPAKRKEKQMLIYCLCLYHMKYNEEYEFQKYAEMLKDVGNYRGVTLLEEYYGTYDEKILKECADACDPKAQYLYGQRIKEKDYLEYVLYTLSSAENGCVDAYYEASLVYEKAMMYDMCIKYITLGTLKRNNKCLTRGNELRLEKKFRPSRKIAGILNRYK